MIQENLRNVAIIAHVDHGKTTLFCYKLRIVWRSFVFYESFQIER